MTDTGFHVYILTNSTKKVLYTGITNDLSSRLVEHYLERGNKKTFTGRYYCHYLLHYEYHHTAIGAIEREKEIKGWRRAKKEELINSQNPKWEFLNHEVTTWPPEPGAGRQY
ncbi:GIY-YIG nuclease family protein [Roseivirga sp. E12]|uniref:GIY-YIG nuclease family protein n=1 Tax=Roseivirga sp. E12 TaxID=2819237 RepID=UPI001ABC4072|nr:GIY-YIG nuclease family protein [Roseivirga sp. E12]MBO3697387.1 GIY-YIG nuclease family protein [Roseivirga sp. E12]